MNDLYANEFPSTFDTALSTFTKEDCLAIASSNSRFESKEDISRLHLAVIYLRENINNFDEDEIKLVFSNEHFLNNVGDKFGQSVLNRCIRTGVSSPIIFNDWKSKKINTNLIKSYLKIIIEEENKEQLAFFTKFHTNTVKGFFDENKNVSESLLEVFLESYLNNNPLYIFSINWPENKVCNWLNSHKDILPELALDTFNATFRNCTKLTPKIDDILYDSIAQKFLNFSLDSGEIKFKGSVLMNTYLKTSFLKNMEKHYPDEYKKVLSIKVSNNEHPLTTVNLGQYTILKRLFSSASDMQQFFSSQKDILLEPIKLSLHLYDREVSIFEYGLEKSNFMPFVPFSLNDDLTMAQKEQLVAGAFCLLQCEYGVFYNEYLDNQSVEYNKVLSKWFPHIIQQATDEQVYHYSEKIISDTDNEGIKKELEQLKLYRSLNADLSNNGSITKKVKI